MLPHQPWAPPIYETCRATGWEVKAKQANSEGPRKKVSLGSQRASSQPAGRWAIKVGSSQGEPTLGFTHRAARSALTCKLLQTAAEKHHVQDPIGVRAFGCRPSRPHPRAAAFVIFIPSGRCLLQKPGSGAPGACAHVPGCPFSWQCHLDSAPTPRDTCSLPGRQGRLSRMEMPKAPSLHTVPLLGHPFNPLIPRPAPHAPHLLGATQPHQGKEARVVGCRSDNR